MIHGIQIDTHTQKKEKKRESSSKNYKLHVFKKWKLLQKSTKKAPRKINGWNLKITQGRKGK